MRSTERASGQPARNGGPTPPRQGLTGADNAEDEIVAWLLFDYRPTTALSPWNGGSGLGLGFTGAGAQKASSRTVPALHEVATLGTRTTGWAATLAIATDLVHYARAHGWTKQELVTHCHNRFPDPRWVDACWTVRTTDTGETLVADRSLGTGGNIGSGDLGAIAARRVRDVCTSHLSERWLIDTLTAGTTTPLISDTAAHLAFPGLVNPWRWLLALEGLIAVAAINAWIPGTRTRPSRCFTTGGLYDRNAPDVDSALWVPTWDGYYSWPSVRRELASWLRWRGRDAHTTADAIYGNHADNLHGWVYPIAPRNGQNPVVLGGSPAIPTH